MTEFKQDNEITAIIHGGATGADTLGGQWALQHGIEVDKYEILASDWKKYGFAAGPIRNQRMLDQGKPDYVIAFPGGNGTTDMVNRAREAGVPVKEVEDATDPRSS